MIQIIEEDYPGCKYVYYVEKKHTFEERIAARQALDDKKIDYISGSSDNIGCYTFTTEQDAFWFSLGH
jgi:hypothetical protein